MLAFRFLAFGWNYSQRLCQRVLECLVEEVALVEVLVFIDLNHVLVVVLGRMRVRTQASCSLDALCATGAAISPKSTLELVIDVAWGQRGKPGTCCWRTRCAYRGAFAMCGGSSNFGGTRNGSADLRWGIACTCQGLRPVCFRVPPPPHFSPLKLLCSMCVVCVLALPAAMCCAAEGAE